MEKGVALSLLKGEGCLRRRLGEGEKCSRLKESIDQK
jgi:hypothetical protein